MPDDEPVFRLPAGPAFAAFRIFDAAGTALSPASVIVACLVAVVLGFSGQLVDQILPVESVATRPGAEWLGSARLAHGFPFLDSSIGEAFVSPWGNVIDPVIVALQSGRSLTVRLNGFVRFILALAAWSLIGVLLCRRTAVLLNRDDRSSFFAAFRYALRRWSRVLRAPLIPLMAALLVGGLIAILGMGGRLHSMGSIWLFITSPIVAVLGLGTAILLLSTAIGWPLMVAAISTDDCDSFGSISRAYSGLSGRPWHAAAYGLLGLIAGCGVMLLVTVIARTTVWCCVSATAFSSGSEPALAGLLPPLTRLIEDLVRGVGASCFWSISTVIYLLLRREVDGVPLDRIALDDDQRPARDPLPVVGIPATDVIVEKPA